MNKFKILLVVICAAVIINIGATTVRKNILEKDGKVKFANKNIEMQYDLVYK